uniref:Uncharacterized protein n=1 Tax=uncultured organism TaxID=155900 RepID=D8VN66_9ZZZZ|nr:hypothetical protein [uncultured organism]
MNDEVVGMLELLLDLGILDSATELDDFELLIALDLIELATLVLDLLAGVDEVAAPHKLPFTLGMPAMPFA